MTDLEISKALARAIGWKRVDENLVGQCIVRDMHSFWQKFDYRDWNVIGPIAEKYKMSVDFEVNIAWMPNANRGKRGDTPQKTIALAAIEGAKK